jgi:hypothetical protein
MPFNWREFLIIAHELRNQTSEGAQRTCLGRAYYYVYNLGLGKATELGFTRNPRSSVHQQLWDWCQGQTDPDIRQLGITGNRMKSLRVSADYYDSISDLAGKVKLQLERAQQFESLVAKSNGQPPPPKLDSP